MNTELAGCARCTFQIQERLCQQEDGKSPPYCPTQNCKEVIDQALGEFKKPDVLEFARQAFDQEGEGYANRGLPQDMSHLTVGHIRNSLGDIFLFELSGPSDQ